MSQKHKVIVAGHVALDLTPVIPPERKYNSVSEFLIPGILVDVGKVQFSVGGAVSNTGLAMKKLGADVSLMGKIGDDDLGKIVQRKYAEYGAGGLIVDSLVSTSYTVVIAAPGLDRIFLHDPAANNTFRCDDISDEALDGAELFHFGYPPLMRSIYENNGEELLKLYKRVKSKGILTSLDMAVVDPQGEAAKQNWPLILKEVLPYVDYFVPSLDEILFMLGPDFTDAKSAANECFRLGAKTVLIKCGTDGMYYKTAETEGAQPCFRPPFVASATGAGDTSIAAFLYSQLEGKSAEESARIAAMEGACCCTAYDTISGLKTIPELEQMIRDYKE
ncbi:MAG: carbohydrate kinase family protein [Eubacteriales bacterium]|nr:carbohydrate kinase family protein [Eubacteriales bacterium]